MGKRIVLILLVLFVTACVSSTPASTDTAVPSKTPAPTETMPPSPSPTSTNTPTPHPTPTPPVVWEELPSAVDGIYFETGDKYWFASPGEGRNEISDVPSFGSPTNRYEPISFSNHSDLMAYWIPKETGSELWISDLALTEQRLIYIDKEDHFINEFNNRISIVGNLDWSANDTQLFIVRLANGRFSLRYDLNTNEISTWEFDCSTIALSPKTERVATWCPSTAGKPEYAVLEWDGNLWFSETSPSIAYAKERRLWNWSSDGQRIAYFDSQTTDQLFTVSDNQGEILYQTSYVVEFDTAMDPIGNPEISLDFIQWSQNNERILVLVNESPTKPCPNQGGEDSFEGGRDVACWHILDADSGELVWNIGDFLATDSTDLYFYTQSLSASGRYLYLSYGLPWIRGACGFSIIDSNNPQAPESTGANFESHFCIFNMRWGVTP